MQDHIKLAVELGAGRYGPSEIEQLLGLIETLRAHVEALSESLNQSKTEISDLRNAKNLALTTKQETRDKAKLRATSGQGADEPGFMRLIDEKLNRPLVFDGNHKDVRGCPRSVMANLDSKYPGFRTMFTVIERAESMSNDADLQQ